MNISYNWLKRYIETDLPAEEVARILTASKRTFRPRRWPVS